MNYLDQPKCPECDGTGWVITQKPATEFYGPDAIGMIDFAYKCPVCNGGTVEAKRIQKRANIPAGYTGVYMKDFNWKVYPEEFGTLEKEQQFVNSFVNEFDTWREAGIGLYIWSRMKGSGKTFLASVIHNTLTKKKHIKGLFVPVPELITIQKSASKDKYAPTYEGDPILKLCKVDLLVLDDLGQNSAANGWISDILFRICDYRMQNKLVTIVTSNAKLWELPFDDRINDRLNKMLQPLPLPNYCVRAREANTEKRELFTKLGLMKQKQPEQLTLEGTR